MATAVSTAIAPIRKKMFCQYHQTAVEIEINVFDKFRRRFIFVRYFLSHIEQETHGCLPRL